ncbi:hypothetical protein HFO95_21750 [Rhizobium leguminosarum]|nr:hypothetical protein [Rhizobium leguminosarum]
MEYLLKGIKTHHCAVDHQKNIKCQSGIDVIDIPFKEVFLQDGPFSLYFSCYIGSCISRTNLIGNGFDDKGQLNLVEDPSSTVNESVIELITGSINGATRTALHSCFGQANVPPAKPWPRGNDLP